MSGPVRELQAFLSAALYDPVPRDHAEPAQALRRRRWVSAATLVVGVVVLGVALRQTPGDPAFYGWTLALAVVWALGAALSGRLHLGHATTRRGQRLARPWVQSLALATLAVAVFLAGALIVGRIPLLRGWIDDLLDHARYGSLPVVLGLTIVNGLAEELFFRGGLYAAVDRRHAVAVTTGVYALTTVATGNPMLVFAAAVLGLLTGAQRRVTGGVLGPAITHVIWSSSMLLLLPPIMEAFR